MKKIFTLVVSLGVGAVLLLVLLYFVGVMKPEPPALAAQPLNIPTYASSIDVPVSIALARLQEILEQNAPKTVSGTEYPNVPGNVDRESLGWSATRGPISVSAVNGALVVSTDIHGGATLHARYCPFGRRLRCKGFRESADLAAKVSVAISNIHLTKDWKLTATMTPNVDVTQAESRVFGFVKVSFRGKLEEGINKAIPQVQSAFGSFLDQLNVRQELEKAWAATNHVIKVYDDPSVWVVLDPRSVAVAPVNIADGQLSTTLRLVANVKTVIGSKPADQKGTIPAQLDDVLGALPAFELKVPLILPLSTISDEANKCCLPMTLPLGSKTVDLSELKLREGAGKLIVEVKFSSGWFGTRGTAYLEGIPSLSADKNTLSVQKLDFDIRTKERLADGAAELLKPVVLEKIADALQVDLRPHYETGLTTIRERLAALSVGEEVEFKSDIQSVSVEDLFVGDAKLALVAVAKGSVLVSAP